MFRWRTSAGFAAGGSSIAMALFGPSSFGGSAGFSVLGGSLPSFGVSTGSAAFGLSLSTGVSAAGSVSVGGSTASRPGKARRSASACSLARSACVAYSSLAPSE